MVGHTFGKLQVIGDSGNHVKRNGNKGAKRWLCRCECGNETVVMTGNLKNGHTQSCGCLRVKNGLNPLNYNGQGEVRVGAERKTYKGRKKSTHGYILIYDGRRNGKTMYKLEHVLVMEQILGRPLLPEENVHHKNGVKDDNRPENLELWSRHQPTGQRVIDKVAYAKEILRLYEPEALA